MIKSSMTQIYIGIGSNIKREYYIKLALSSLEKYFDNLDYSRVYESKPVGFRGENFFNMVVGAKVTYDLEQVVNILETIEVLADRDRTVPKFSSRTLDLDLLIFGKKVCTMPVTLPNTEIMVHAFVLCPLAEIAPDYIHPVSKVSFSQLWREWDNKLQEVWPIKFE